MQGDSNTDLPKRNAPKDQEEIGGIEYKERFWSEQPPDEPGLYLVFSYIDQSYIAVKVDGVLNAKSACGYYCDISVEKIPGKWFYGIFEH